VAGANELPPIILHPFNYGSDATESTEFICYSAPTKRYLETRYSEFRMLCLIGKDLNRWLEQCVEMTSGDPLMAGVHEDAFIAALLFAPPVAVLKKLRSWGVINFQVIFSRAIGLNAAFPHPPSPSAVSESFLREFHKYADAMFDARLGSKDVERAREDPFTFEIFASGEYSSYLEKSWEE